MAYDRQNKYACMLYPLSIHSKKFSTREQLLAYYNFSANVENQECFPVSFLWYFQSPVKWNEMRFLKEPQHFFLFNCSRERASRKAELVLNDLSSYCCFLQHFSTAHETMMQWKSSLNLKLCTLTKAFGYKIYWSIANHNKIIDTHPVLFDPSLRARNPKV